MNEWEVGVWNLLEDGDGFTGHVDWVEWFIG
jgi:hypothetical protein